MPLPCGQQRRTSFYSYLRHRCDCSTSFGTSQIDQAQKDHVPASTSICVRIDAALSAATLTRPAHAERSDFPEEISAPVEEVTSRPNSADNVASVSDGDLVRAVRPLVIILWCLLPLLLLSFVASIVVKIRTCFAEWRDEQRERRWVRQHREEWRMQLVADGQWTGMVIHWSDGSVECIV